MRKQKLFEKGRQEIVECHEKITNGKLKKESGGGKSKELKNSKNEKCTRDA